LVKKKDFNVGEMSRVTKQLSTIVPELKRMLSVMPVFCLILAVSAVGRAQGYQGIPADTSFNPGSELRKLAGSYPGISLAETGDTSTLTIYRNLVYSASGSRELHLDLFLERDQGNRKYSLVILVHGGGWRSGNRSMDHPMAAELARRGYAAACVEYRLSGEALYPAGILDVKTALRWLRSNSRKFSLDRNRFALAGSSAGGQMAALVGTLNGKGTIFRVKTTDVPQTKYRLW
jgi:pectinesterase